MGWAQIAGAIVVFIIERIRRKWEADASKEKRYAELEKKLWEAIKARDTVKYFNVRRELLELRSQV